MRITFVLQYYHPYVGGLESLSSHLAEGLAQRGHQVQVITTHLPDTPLHETRNGVQIKRVRTPRFADRYFFILLGLPAALRAARQSDILHTAPYAGALPGFISAALAHRPIVFTALEILGRRWFKVENNIVKAATYFLFERLAYSLPYRSVISISEATLNDLIYSNILATRNLSVIHCGVDNDLLRPEPDAPLNRAGSTRESFTYLYYGRPGLTKGVDVLLRAAPAIQKAIPNARLVLVLANEPRAQYQKMLRLAASFKNAADIQIISSMPRQELLNHLRRADCIVVPSLTEGFGLTTAEACALNIPVVATRAGAIPEVISGRHVLVEPGSPDALAEGVLRIWRGDWDETPRKVFSWEAMVAAYEKIYQEILGA